MSKFSKRQLFGGFCALMIGLPIIVQAMAPQRLGACVILIEEEEIMTSEAISRELEK